MTSIADEIDRLAAQRDAGRLTDAEFEAAKARVLASTGADWRATPIGTNVDEAYANVKRLRRALADRWIGGVCGGVAQWLGVESWIVRLAFALSVVCVGFGLIPYILLWIFVPVEGR